MYDQVTLKLNVDPWILSALKEDITSEDVSTNSVMPHPQAGEVDLICKEDGIICGLQVFERVFTLLDEKTTVEFLVQDGAEVHKGQLMAKVHGDIRTLLCGERTALNYLQRMSGIATYTHSVAELLKGTGIKLLDTRKTTPNNRIFEKYAVRIGGGNNHRYNLSDGVLLKDNHIGAAGGVKEAIAAAKKYAPFVRKIEVEVENLDMVKEAVEEAEKTAEATKEEAAEDEAKEAETEDSKESDTEEKKSGKKLFGKKDKKDKKDEKIEELTDRLTRQMAEFDNFRKRTEKEKSQMYEVGAKDIIEKILPVVDNFERGLDAVKEEDKEDPFIQGMEKVYKQLMTTLEGIEVKPIEAVGQEFDPNLHNAVMHVEDENLGENIIAEEFQKGYMYRDSVVRHSMVKVAN